MSYLNQEAQRLSASQRAATAYVQKVRSTLDAADPKAASRLRHAQDVEAALQGTRDFVEAVDALLHPPPSPLAQRVQAHLSQPHLQARLEYPHPICHALAAITAFHLPRNPALNELARQFPAP